jgi:hypothetical protein
MIYEWQLNHQVRADEARAKLDVCEAERDRAVDLVRELNAALSSEWPGIADRLDGTDLQGEAVDIGEAWERSRLALEHARTFLASTEESNQ